jgi:hypothetical protein
LNFDRDFRPTPEELGSAHGEWPGSLRRQKGNHVMGDEVTKKDLQSLQGYINKRLADLTKVVADMKTASGKDSEELDGIIVRVRHDLERRLDRNDARLASLENAINTLAKAIADVARKAGS